MPERRDEPLQELLELHKQLADLPPDDFATRHELLSRVDELRNELAAQPRRVGAEERKTIKAELRALRALRGEYAEISAEQRWGTNVSIWDFWRRFRSLTLEDRPSYPVRRVPGNAEGGEPWSTAPNYLLFQPEMQAINDRIGLLEARLRGRRGIGSKARWRSRHAYRGQADRDPT